MLCRVSYHPDGVTIQPHIRVAMRPMEDLPYGWYWNASGHLFVPNYRWDMREVGYTERDRFVLLGERDGLEMDLDISRAIF